MKITATVQKIIPESSLKKEDVRYGMQLAAAVLIAYAIPLLMHIPEGFWAVMTALIVMRSHTGATMEEGWARLKGALAGTAGGLFGVWLHAHGVLNAAVVLVMIAVMAFVAGLAPKLRAAPITALIILSSGGIPGHGPWQVAGLRIIEITIGIVAGLGVSLLTSGPRTAAHFDTSVRGLLRDIGDQCRRTLSGEPTPALDKDKDEVAQEIRGRLKKLVIMAMSADTEHRMKRVKADKQEAQKHERYARLLARTVQDVGLFSRIYDAQPELQSCTTWGRIAQALPLALDMITAEKQEEGKDAVQVLIACLHQDTDTDASPSAARLHRLLAGPISLLAADIRLLRRLRPV
jgi:uncharacterized membrane protein YccC